MLPRFYIGALDEATYTASAAADASFPLDNLKTYNPADLWKSSANTNGQTLKIDLDSAKPRNYCILHGSNFSGMTSVVLEAADDSAYSINLVTVVADLRNANSIVKFEFTAIWKRYWRILFTNTNSTIPQLGQIFINQKFEAPSSYDFGYKPENEAFETTVRKSALSGLLRKSQVYAGRLKYEIRFTIQNNKFLEDWKWFLQKTRGSLYPFYFYNHDDEVFYFYAEKDFTPAEVKAYKINDVVSFAMESQSVAQNEFTQQTNPMAIDLDGSTEYCSKASPVNLDMNGSEKITNPDFETNLSGWTSVGNHTGTRITLDSHTGIACAEIVASGAGGGSDLFYHSVAGLFLRGEKNTIEFWAKSISGNTTLHCESWGSDLSIDTVLTASWAKYIINGVTNVTNESLFFWLSGAGTFRLDDVSFTKAYDFTILVWIKSSFTEGQRIINRQGSGDNVVFLSASGKAGLYISAPGEIDTLIYGTITVNDGVEHLVAVTFNRTGNAVIFVNGVADVSSSLAAKGKMWHLGNLVLGRYWGDALLFFKGQLSELQVIRGSALSAADILAAYQRGISKTPDPATYPNAQVVAHYKWRGASDADFLKDEAGYNNLTGTNVTQALDQAIGSYPCIDL